MSAVALESSLHRTDVPRRALQAVALSPTSVEAIAASANIQPWELHSELVLVCPELRGRSLELLPERRPESLPSRSLAPIVLRPLAPAEDELPLRPENLRSFTLRRCGESLRNGLTIVGAFFTLAMVAELLAR